ncbi:repressor of RNA polymerase III transcription MAF1 [Sporormia fimetaria CBS 119925]|uniref:Repressor of RNA polymerase III transcription MAF1 n=1 Tax=Sporormia fimetaria CBS 119925 TaxID=1340428 RepID=A0A6A6VF95_9PLEO|nr:repressor of RNA polymerase III transcription MAF1 [Sporormia fimetaria CBS 119925]
MITNAVEQQYLDILHEVNHALNFDTDDTSVLGGCDVYTIKAAGCDKKLYKRIEETLEQRHKELMDALEAMTPRSAARFADEFNVGRITPFGTFKEAANRHKFAYLIATLNATHIDYDFANTCNPDEFRRETKSQFMTIIDNNMHNLRPKAYSAGLLAGAMTPNGTPIWSPQHWTMLDFEMSLDDCEYYAWEPADDPFADDGAIWSLHHFMYNKERKRVCYFYLRGLSALSTSPPAAMSLVTKLKQAQYEQSPNRGSRKRAEYWLGHRAKKGLQVYGESDELDNMVIDHPGDIVDADFVEEFGSDFDDDSELEPYLDHGKIAVRRMSTRSSPMDF